MSFFNELKRRNVLRIGAAYVVVSWLLIQVAETIFPLFGFDDTPARIVVLVLAIGLVPSMIFAWAFELTPEGLKKGIRGRPCTIYYPAYRQESVCLHCIKGNPLALWCGTNGIMLCLEA